MSYEQQNYSKRYERSFCLKSRSDMTQYVNINNSIIKRTGIINTKSQKEELHSTRLQRNEPYQIRQVYSCGVTDFALTGQNQSDPIKIEEEKLRYKLCNLRKWEYTKFGKLLQQDKTKQPKHYLKFTILSYNVLSQHLLEEHTYLYRNVHPDALVWEKRAERILREVKDTYADVLCLQEIQSDHFNTYYAPKLRSMGFKGIFKKRTGNKLDGCAIFFRHTKFELKYSKSVEYYKPNVQILDRDNIGLIALLMPRVLKNKYPVHDDVPFIVVATTHLLYNPKRHDIKLAQLQLLFAELDRLAFNCKHDNSSNNSNLQLYHPTILTGDFNITPNSSVYEFITRGALQFKGLNRRELISEARGQMLDEELIPRHLNVTDQCQHLCETEKRTSSSINSHKIPELCDQCGVQRFSTGLLTHNLQFQSVYPHRLNRLNGCHEATTYQNDWVTVDYIFYKYVMYWKTFIRRC